MSKHSQADKAKDDAEKAARKARKFTERMYKSRYQNTMEDMRLAGLNPLLAYQQGVGGGFGSTSQGQGFMGEGAGAIMGGIGSMMGGGAASSQASSAKKLRTQQGLLTEAQVGATNAAKGQSESQTRLNDATAVGAVHNARSAGLAADYLALEEPRRVREAEFDASWPGRILGHIGKASRELGPLGAGIGGFIVGKSRRGAPGRSQVRFGKPDDTRFGGTKGMTPKQAAQYEKWMNTYKSPRPGPNYRGPNR